ncbi:MAG: Mut7-C RNAse domain-containing protein [Syntrophaceae bacterium]|nr:Mut7-C RNAse domain-containing protein [Syntrophaceae bacterium]
MNFITDRTLGKLAKWLRILGYDTLYYTGAIDRSFLQRGVKEGRIVLTRRRDMARRNFRGRMVIVRADRVVDQIREIIDALSLKPENDKLLSVCIRCNEVLRVVSKTEEIKERVPGYVFQTQEIFHICPHCEDIYWAGTHKEKILSFIQEHNLTGHP